MLITAAQAAKMLGVSHNRVIKLITAGRLPAVRYGGFANSPYLIHEEDLKLVADRKPGNPNKERKKK